MKKTCQIVEFVLMVLALLFTTIGCERELNKSTELKESVEETKSLNEAPPDGAEVQELGVIIERNVPVPMRDAASRPYAVVVDENTLEHPKWGQVVEALKEKYNAKVFVAHYPEVGTVRKALNEYMPWYVCFVAQPEQATRKMISAAAHTMTWLDDDPYEDAIWAVLTGFVPEDALRIVNAEPLLVRRGLANVWDGWLDWLEGGFSLDSDKREEYVYKFVKNINGVKQRLDRPKEITTEFIELLNRDDCDIISTSAHATEHFFYLGYPDPDSDGFITHDEKGNIYGVDILGEVHQVTAKKPKIYYAPGNCLIGHIDGQSCLSLAWIHNGANQFFGYLYTASPPHDTWNIADYFLALQDQYTFAEATYAHWLALRFSVNELIEAYPSSTLGGKGTILYGDPAWEARVKRTTKPAYSQDIDIENLSDGLMKMTVSITINREWKPWVIGIRPVILFPFRLKQVWIEKTDVDKVAVADNFIVLDLDTRSIGGPRFPVGTKKSVVLYARKLKVWPFLSEDEVIAHVNKQQSNNIFKYIEAFTDDTVDPNDRIKKAGMWDAIFLTSQIPIGSHEKETELLNKLVTALYNDHPMIRGKAAEIVGCFQFQPSVSVPALRRALKDGAIWQREKNPISVRNAAISSLGMFGKDAHDAVPDIIQLLPKLSGDDKVVALRTLGEIGAGDDKVFIILREIATDPNYSTDPNTNKAQNEIRLAAIDGLGNFGMDDPRVREILFSLADDESESIRRTSIRNFFFVEHPDEEIIETLINAVEDRSWRVRLSALRGLSSLKVISEDIVNKYINAVKDESSWVRLDAVRVLSSTKTVSSKIENALQYAAKDNNPRVSEKAKQALRKFGCKIQD